MSKKRKRGWGDDSDDDSDEEVIPPPKKRKKESIGDNLRGEDKEIFYKLKEINNKHSLWTYFNQLDQESFGPNFNFIVMETFSHFERKYQDAVKQYDNDNEIKKANNANVLNTYVANKSQTGNLVVMFMNIGSGDCIFIQTPKGKTIVVDCGQRCRPERADYQTEIKNMLKSVVFLGGENNPLYALILTHPDQDHYNEVKEIIAPCVSEVLHLFYTLDKAGYSENKTNQFMNKAKIINKVTINNDEVSIDTSEEKGWMNLYDKDKNKRKIQILGNRQGRAAWDEDNCNIYLLAAEVPNHHNDTQANAASIIILIEAHGRRILLCGDGTLSTESFLLSAHPDIIKNVDLMQLEHHGSGTEHAGIKFVATINPVLAAASSGQHQTDMNPRWNTIVKYVTSTKSNDSKHRLCESMDHHKIKYADLKGWTNMNKNEWIKTYPTYGLFTTDSNSDLCFMVDKDGNLIREYSVGEDTYTYTIDKEGTVTVKKRSNVKK
jgi:beta-lactamase superfamily II metal-dependent hydrolase